MGFFPELIAGLFGVVNQQTASCRVEVHQTTHETAQRATSNTQQAKKPPVTPAQPTLIKEPDDLGTPDLPRPNEVPWLNDPRKAKAALTALDHGRPYTWQWERYYLKREALEEVVYKQEQYCYDDFWSDMRECWKLLHHPFWSAYIAGHFPDPQAVKGNPMLTREICVLDVKELKSRQSDSLVKESVYTLGVLQNGLFNDRWQPENITDRDKWYFRKVLMQYGLEVPPSDEPDPIPFAELFIGAVFGVKVTPEKRLSSCDFIQGDEPFEDRVRRIQEEGLVTEWRISGCEDDMFYSLPTDTRYANWAVSDARKALKARKILAGGDYPEVRSAVMEGVDLDQLEKVLVKDLGLSSRAWRRIQQEHFSSMADELTLADLITRDYHNWLVGANDSASTEIKEYLYQHHYVIRPEDMPMDERTHFAYLGLPVRIRDGLRYPGRVETIDDLVRCCSGKDPVFTLRYTRGIGKKSMEAIQARLVELGFLANAQ